MSSSQTSMLVRLPDGCSPNGSANGETIGKAKTVAESITSSGGRALAVPGDMLDDNYINELVKKAAEFGGGKIHIIVNNAGYTWDGVIHKVWHKIRSA